MKKKIRTLIIVLALIVVSINYVDAASFNDINDESVFLVQEKGKGRCTLVSTTMMIRRAMILNGEIGWEKLTERSMKENTNVWTNSGLKWSFTFNGYKVNSVGGTTDLDKLWNLSDTKKVELFKSLLKEHPEGIVMWCKYEHDLNKGNHAVLLTDYTNGKFYCADPAKSSKRILLKDASVSMSNALRYWYISSPSLTMDKMLINSKTGRPDDAVKFRNNYYYVVYDYASWPEAKNICLSYGGHLATIEDEEEEKFIESLNVDKTKLWLGGYRQSDGNWAWITEEKFEYTSWKSTPSSAGSKKYITLYNGGWKNLAKNSTAPVGYICEWEGYKISTNSDNLVVNKNASAKIDYSVKLLNQNVDITPTFSSSNKSIATVNKKGEVTGVKTGISTVTLKVGESSAKNNVIVRPQKIDNIASYDITKNTIKLKWDALEGVDGYKIYAYDKKLKQYIRIKTISDPSVTAYKVKNISGRKLSSKTQYSFKVRAFIKYENQIYYGKYSSIKVETIK